MQYYEKVIIPHNVENLRGQFDLENATDNIQESYIRRLSERTPMSDREGD